VSDTAPSDFVHFAGGGFHGEVARAHRPENLVEEVTSLVDPSAAIETIHWGRNYIYAAKMETSAGSVPVAVKQFKNQGLKNRIERHLRGSKAERSWRVAKELVSAGLGTPEPLLWVESDADEGPSFFVARLLPGAVEVRQFFRRLNGDPDEGEFPEVENKDFLRRLGRFARKINDAGILYRDLSMGNVLAVQGDDELDLYLVDFNRARIGREPGVVRRTRDICRLPVLQRDHRAAFLEGYWGKAPSRWSFRWCFYALSVDGYILKHAIKKRLEFLRLRRRHAHGGSHHAHIPAALDGASARDKAVWDYLSDQPHQHASSREKFIIRLADGPTHLRNIGIAGASASKIYRRYRKLHAGLYEQEREIDGIGLAVRPWSRDPEDQLQEIDALGVGPILMRLHPWDSDHGEEERLAEALVERGHELAFAIPQNRDLVRDRELWRASIAELAERFRPYGRHFQIGQAINRSKWGVWTHGEYIDLYRDAEGILRQTGNVEVLGPSVIDFEFQALAALVNRRTPLLHFDIVSSLLYVDRRGAPENRQVGLDTVDKVTLLRAIAETGRNCSDRCWITEFNWPLWEGPHSPAGKTVSVGEEEQADYLLRYFLLTLGTGYVERVFWWRLIARGYGLISPSSDGSLRRRSSWYTLRNMIDQIEGATFTGPLAAPAGAFLYHFTRRGDEIIVGWSVRRGVRAALPRVARAAVTRDGGAAPLPDGTEVELGPSPVFFLLE
jgi:tRNA A-37 threonylcarbamoyl transferase component Bud32